MDGSDKCLVVNVQLPSRDDVCTFLDRLRGRYVIPIRDGAGPLNGKDQFSRTFQVPPIAVASADLISVLALFAYTSSESPAELHDLAAALLQAPSLSHGCYSPEDTAVVIDEMLGRVPSEADEEPAVPDCYVASCSEDRLVSVLTEVCSGWMNEEWKQKYRAAITDAVRRLAADFVTLQCETDACPQCSGNGGDL